MSQTIAMERIAPHAEVAASGARVDVIMPMWNAAETVEIALRALQAQTMPDWRALVVDNGSTDDGPARVRTLAASDSRIVLLSEAARGASQARNRGLRGSSAEWLLFMDADDFIAPRHLERLLSVAETEPGVCAVVSGAARCTPDGRIWARTEPEFSDPFDTFGQMGVLFPIHSCIWRRNLVLAQGGFRTDLAIAEDWDLWIRMARAGLRMGRSPEVTCFYVMRPGSLSGQPQALDDALEVLRSAHRPDPANAHAPVRSPFDLPRLELNLILWSAARRIASGEESAPTIHRLERAPVCGFDVAHIADLMLDGLTVGAGRPPEDLAARWPEFAPRLQALFALCSTHIAHLQTEQQRSEAGGGAAVHPGLPATPQGWRRLFESCHWALWERIAQGGALLPQPQMPGVMFLAHDLRTPFRDIPAEPGAECLLVAFCLDGQRMGMAAVPLLGPGAPAGQIATAAARALEGASAVRLLRGAGLSRKPGFWLGAGRAAASLRGTGLIRGRAGAALWREHARRVVRRGLAGALRQRVAGDAGFLAQWEAALQARTGAGRWEGDQLAPSRQKRPDAPAATSWENFFQQEDPWQYDNPYETRKYAETLELLPRSNTGRVLELACAEGHFTQRLAARAGELLATDVSATAIERAAARCANAKNVKFSVLNAAVDPLPQGLDAIFCSEFLYYLKPAAVAGLIGRMRAALRPGGVIIHAHALSLDDDRTRTAFDWRMPSTLTQIEAAFQATAGLALRKEIASELYRVQLYERSEAGAEPVREFRPLDRPLPMLVARQTVEGGAILRRGEAACLARSPRIPVLMYHRVTDAPHPALAQFAVSPARFEAHLRLLRRNGYHAISPRTLAQALEQGRSPPGRPVLITFDDGYVDFLEAAVPLLQRHDFTATVFAVPGRQAADWDRSRGEAAALMTDAQLRQVRAAGMDIGSHSFSHQGLTRLSRDAVFAEAVQSKARLQALLGEEVVSIAYPFGDADEFVQEACALAGYRIGFSTRHAFATLHSHAMAVERLEVTGATDAAKLAAMLGLPAPD